MTLLTILLLTLLGSIISLCGGLVLLLKKTWDQRFSLILTSFAAGVLLATAFLDLFPEALEHTAEIGGNLGSIFAPALGGIVLFFLLERTLLWFHHHHFHQHHETHEPKPTIWMITLGDGLHNFIDGVAIAAAFMSNPALGITTALAVAAHEVPQEIADFSVLLSQKISKMRAILFNVGSALTSIVGAICMYVFSEQLQASLGSVIAFTAGMFAYIALSDLIPELHHSQNKKETIPQAGAFIIGILLVILIKSLIGDAAHAL